MFFLLEFYQIPELSLFIISIPDNQVGNVLHFNNGKSDFMTYVLVQCAMHDSTFFVYKMQMLVFLNVSQINSDVIKYGMN